MKLSRTIIFLFIALNIFKMHGLRCQEIMPLSDVKPGMTGIARTVFSGEDIEEFSVKIIDILKNYRPQQDLILASCSGEKIDFTGVAAGMSGSPVYIEGKLVGALSIRVGSFTKKPIAGITPIEQMLDILKKEQQRDSENLHYSSIPSYLQYALGAADEADTDPFISIMQHTNSGQSDDYFTPIPSPVVLSGFTPDVVSYLNEKLKDFGYVTVTGGSSQLTDFDSEHDFKPGSAVSRVILDGDMSIDVAGTVTWRSSDSLLAFGHGAFGTGSINVPMARTKILTTIPSLMGSDKISMATSIAGTFRQDRVSGVFGIVGEKPKMIPITITCRTAAGENYNYSFRLAEERQLNSHNPFFLRAAIINAIVTSRLSGADYSTRAKGTITLENGREVVIDNLYSGSQFFGMLAPLNDATKAADDVTLMIAALMVNEFPSSPIKKIDLQFDEIPGFAYADIMEIWHDKKLVSPGDTVTVTVLLRPYKQGETIRVSQKISIPINLSTRYVTLHIGSASFLGDIERRKTKYKYIPKNHEHLVDLLNSKRKNNALYLQTVAPYTGIMEGDAELPDLPASVLTVMNSRKISANKHMSSYVLNEESFPMKYSINGGKTILIRVNQQP